ncbi:ANTAR domain-containing protein [Streptomyces sp. NPDC007851]|uniref:ANTAR domain-containing protein n=1 Tax=Streptomyces sp. NPDC007851 TaxID=3155008 RepID=UPI003408427A
MSDQLSAPPDTWREQCTVCGAVRRPASCVPALSWTVHSDTDGGQSVVSAADELDRSGDGVEVDLAGIRFCDCSGLHVLLRVRHRAREAAKALTVRFSSRAVQRLLELNGTVDVLATRTKAAQDSGTDSRTETEHLRRALQTRPTIDMARGILMASYALTSEQAWHVLVTTSQNSNTKLHVLAERLLGTVHGPKLPEPLAGQLAKALREHTDQG